MAQLHDHAHLFSDGNQYFRTNNSAPGMMPSYERLQSNNTGAVDCNLGLVHEKELAGIQRFVKFRPQRDLHPHLFVHRGSEESIHVPSLPLGPVERHVCMG